MNNILIGHLRSALLGRIESYHRRKSVRAVDRKDLIDISELERGQSQLHRIRSRALF